MAHKSPAFQFYPADWLSDIKLRSCSLSARGLWIDLICFMHQADPYGCIAINGEPVKIDEIFSIFGTKKREFFKNFSELFEKKVIQKTSINGQDFYCSKRMIEDEKTRQGWRERQSRHRGDIEKNNRDVTQDVTGVSRRSSSSTSSSFNPPPPPLPGGGANFAKFCEIYPKKGDIEKLKAIWESGNLEAIGPAIIDAVRRLAKSSQWTEQNGRYVPNPIAFLQKRQWESAQANPVKSCAKNQAREAWREGKRLVHPHYGSFLAQELEPCRIDGKPCGASKANSFRVKGTTDFDSLDHWRLAE